MAWDACPVLSGSYLLGGEFDERPFVTLEEKNKKKVFGGDPHDSAAPWRGKPPASITRQPYSLGGASGGHRGELAKAQHWCGDSLPLDFCRDAGCLIILSFMFGKSPSLSCRSGRVKRLERFAANALLLLNAAQVNVQLKPRCNQKHPTPFSYGLVGEKGTETCFCD